MVEKILFVDDDLVALKMGELMLKSLGYRVFAAVGGESALQVLEEEEIDLIFLDIMMPDIYGIEVLKRLKKNPKFSHIPVVVQTGVRNKKELEEICKLGVVGLMAKPYSKRDMKKMIEKAKIKDAVY